MQNGPISTSSAPPAPPLVGVKRVVRSFTAADGTPLRADYYTAEPAPGSEVAEGSAAKPTKTSAPRGPVLLLHGYCEHRGRYLHVAEHLVRSGYSVFCGDLRGHGESGGARGFVQRFGDYLDDVAAFLAELQALDASGMRPALVGHSLGGLISVQFVLAHPNAVRLLALSSPFLGLKLKVPAWKRGLGLVASLLHPTLRLPNDLDSRNLSHDPAIVDSYATDPLVTHEATARWFTETMAAQSDVRTRASRITLPALFMQAGDDRIVDAAMTKQVFSRVGSKDKTLNEYPGLYHEIFNEVDRQRVLNDLTNWLNER